MSLDEQLEARIEAAKVDFCAGRDDVCLSDCNYVIYEFGWAGQTRLQFDWVAPVPEGLADFYKARVRRAS